MVGKIVCVWGGGGEGGLPPGGFLKAISPVRDKGGRDLNWWDFEILLF